MKQKSVAVVGAAETTKMGRIPDVSVIGLHADAALNAMADCGLKPSDIDGVATAGVSPVELAHYLGIKPNVAKFIVETRPPEHGSSAGDQITEGHASAYSTLYIPMPVVTTSKLIGIQLGQSAGYVVTIRTSGVTTASVTAGSWKYAFVADRGWG